MSTTHAMRTNVEVPDLRPYYGQHVTLTAETMAFRINGNRSRQTTTGQVQTIVTTRYRERTSTTVRFFGGVSVTFAHDDLTEFTIEPVTMSESDNLSWLMAHVRNLHSESE